MVRQSEAFEHHSARPVVHSAGSVRKWTSGPNWAPFLGSGPEAWRKAVMLCLGFYSFLRSSYITDLLCNQAVGGSRKLACTLDKKLNYSRGHLEPGRLGATEEQSGPPTQDTAL